MVMGFQMEFTHIFNVIFKTTIESVSFFVVVITLFNLFTDFMFKMGIIPAELSTRTISYYGIVSIMLALNNILSQKFFGIEIFDA